MAHGVEIIYMTSDYCHLKSCRWVPLGMKYGTKQLESLGYVEMKMCDHTIIHFESIPVCDRQTDGQTDHAPMPLSCCSISECDRSEMIYF